MKKEKPALGSIISWIVMILGGITFIVNQVMLFSMFSKLKKKTTAKTKKK